MQPYYGNISIKIPYMRKGTSSTLIALSTAIALSLLASPLSLSNLLLQPVQAQTVMTFKTPEGEPAIDSEDNYALTFDAQGETFRSSTELYANGTFKITEISGGQVSSGSISRVH